MKAESLRLLSIELVVLLSILILRVSPIGQNMGVIRGRSMEPRLGEGDVILIDKIDADKVRVGDIIAYEVHGKQYVHEVVEIGFVDGQILFRTNCDPMELGHQFRASSDSLLGTVTYSIPRIGLPLAYPEIVLFAAGSICVLSLIRSWSKYLIK